MDDFVIITGIGEESGWKHKEKKWKGRAAIPVPNGVGEFFTNSPFDPSAVSGKFRIPGDTGKEYYCCELYVRPSK